MDIQKDGKALKQGQDWWFVYTSGFFELNWSFLIKRAKKFGVGRAEVLKWIKAYKEANTLVNKGQSNKPDCERYKDLDFLMDYAYWVSKGGVECSPHRDLGRHLRFWGERLIKLSEMNEEQCDKDDKRAGC